MTNAHDFFGTQVPHAWNAQADLIEKMRDLSFTLGIRVDHDEHRLIVHSGIMTADSSSEHTPVLWIALSQSDLDHLAVEIGPSPMLLFGGFVGQNDFVITQKRIDKIEALQGTLALRISDEVDWGFVMHYGSLPIPAEPDTTLLLSASTYRELRESNLSLQKAFLSGEIKLSGSMDLALKTAMALV